MFLRGFSKTFNTSSPPVVSILRHKSQRSPLRPFPLCSLLCYNIKKLVLDILFITVTRKTQHSRRPDKRNDRNAPSEYTDLSGDPSDNESSSQNGLEDWSTEAGASIVDVVSNDGNPSVPSSTADSDTVNFGDLKRISVVVIAQHDEDRVREHSIVGHDKLASLPDDEAPKINRESRMLQQANKSPRRSVCEERRRGSSVEDVTAHEEQPNTALHSTQKSQVAEIPGTDAEPEDDEFEQQVQPGSTQPTPSNYTGRGGDSLTDNSAVRQAADTLRALLLMDHENEGESR